MKLLPGLSFSWKRALSLSGLRCAFSRLLGIPTTRSGLERRLGRMLLKGFPP